MRNRFGNAEELMKRKFNIMAQTVTFKEALEGMKAGHVYARKEWVNQVGVTQITPDTPEVEPFFIGLTARETIVVGVLFTAHDMLTADWVRVS